MTSINWKKEAIKAKAEYLYLYDEAYPDVGMGVTFTSCLNKAAHDFGLPDNDPDLKELFKEHFEQLRR